MSKLFGLKSWLTLAEAADFLSGTLQEPVTVPDLLRLALDGHLVLSTNFVNGTAANIGEKVSWENARLVLFPDLSQPEPFGLPPELARLLGEFPRQGTRQEQHEWLSDNRAISEHPKIIITISGDRIGEDAVLQWQKKVTSIHGLWDLPNVGGAQLDIEHLLQSFTSGVEVTMTCLDGTFVVSPDGLTYARVLEQFDRDPSHKDDQEKEGLQAIISRVRKHPHGDPSGYFPRGGLPEDAPIVVRPAALTTFLALVAGDDGQSNLLAEKPLDERERTTLLCIIGALSRQVQLDLSQPIKAGDTVAAMAPELDLSGRTIGEKLKLVGEAMERRTK